MNGTCHLTFGIAVGTVIALNLSVVSHLFPNIHNSVETGTLFVLGGIVGSLFPDIDNPSSYVGKLCSPVSRMFGRVHRMQGKEEWQHRGIMHDGAVYLTGLLLSYFCFAPLVGLFLGGLTHLFLDMFNPAGIPFMFGVKHFHMGKIKSNEKGAVLFTGICTMIVLMLGAGLYTGIIPIFA